MRLDLQIDVDMHHILINAPHTFCVLGFKLFQNALASAEGGLSQEASGLKFIFAFDRSDQSIDAVHVSFVFEIDRATFGTTRRV